MSNASAIRTWEYPTLARYHTAMAELASSEHNLPYFLGMATSDPSAFNLRHAQNNIAMFAERQANAIAFASIA